MSLSHTIAIEGTDSTIPIGEIEQFVATVTAAGSGVHQPVTVGARAGKVTLSVELSTADDTAE